MLITFQEINAFMQSTQTKLSHWDVLTLRALSGEYISQSTKDGIHEMPPYIDGTEKDYLLQTALSPNTIAQRLGVVLTK